MNILEIMNIPYYKEGNTIHIKKENRGKFTKSAKEHNMGVQEFATHVLNNKDKYNPTLIKRANFAKNSKKFKHAKGGLIKKCQNGGKSEKTKFLKFLDWFSQASLNAAVAGSPSVATAAGWRIDENNNAVQDLQTEEGTKQLQDNLAVISTVPHVVIGGPQVVSAVGKALTNPVVDAGLTIHGATTAPENIKKGVEQIKNDEKLKGYGNLALVGLDLVGAGLLIGRTSRMLNPAFRSKHAYNAIVPAGYGDSSGRFKDWFNSMWYNKDVDLKNPDWLKSDKKLYGEVRPDKGYTGTGDYLPDNIKNRGKIGDEARQDAWALYNNLPQLYGTYIKNEDGTYSYNIDKIIKDSEGTFWPDVDMMDQERYGSAIDAVTGAGGGINSIISKTKHISTGPNTATNHGYVIMEDVWDLHPFSNNDNKMISERLNKKLKEGLGSSKLKNSAQNIRRYMYDKGHWSLFDKPTVLGKATKFLDRPLNRYRMSQHTIVDNTIDKLTKNKLTKKIDDKLSKFEVGPILGGKPFTLKHNLPFIENIEYSKATDGYLRPDKITYQYDFNPPVGISVIDMRKK